MKQGARPRARELGLPLDGTPGPLNAITDVEGVSVGAAELVTEPDERGRALCTGVTAILPRLRERMHERVWAGLHRFNGNGELTGSHWIEDGGSFTGPVLLTSTHSVGVAHHAAIRWMIEHAPEGLAERHQWYLPVVGETYDGVLSDIDAQALGEGHVRAALDAARPGPVAEGNSGGGAGMIAYGFKAGTGTASRTFEAGGLPLRLGALVQANHGLREQLTVCGVPVGRLMPEPPPEAPREELGSIIVVLATDAPLMPHQLARLARRAALGMARGGTIGGNGSGDIFLAFSTANGAPPARLGLDVLDARMLSDECCDPVYEAAVGAVEEAVLNALLAATPRPTVRPPGGTMPAIDGPRLAGIVRTHRG